MLAVLLLARRDEPFDLVFRLCPPSEELQVLLRTISVVGKERLGDAVRLRCSMSSTIGFNCLLSLLASPTVWPTINSNVGSTAACAL